MPRKRHKPEEIVAKLRRSMSCHRKASRCQRRSEPTELTYYRWRQEYGGLRSD
jgi:putative transposase